MRHICVLVAGCVLLIPLTASAAPKKKGSDNSGGVVVAVVGAKGTMDLGETAKVVSGDAIAAAQKRAGKKAWDPDTIAALLAKNGVDVLVRAEKSGDHLTLTGFGRDGDKRWQKDVATASDAARVVGPLISSGAAPLASGPRDDDDILAPAPSSTSAPIARRASAATVEAAKVVKRASIDDDDDSAAPSRTAMLVARSDDAASSAKATERSRVSALSFGGDDGSAKAARAAKKTDDDAPKAKASSHKASIDDDTPAAAEPVKPAPVEHHASLASDADDAPKSSAPTASHGIDGDDAPAAKSDEPKGETIDQVETDAKAHPLDKLRHSFALSAGLDGGVWSYGFDGGTATTQLKTGAGIVPGGSVSFDAAPLAFAGIRFLGVDADVGGAETTFQLQQGSPSQFTSVQLRYGFAAKARYTFGNGIGIGARVGYRYEGSGAGPQQIALNGQNVNVTQVPGYFMNALAVGADVFVPLVVSEHRLEIDLRAEALPVAEYQETPDNPGATATAFGWHAVAAVRYDLLGGLYTEARAETTGARVSYSDVGTRNVIDGGKLTALNGGRVLNMGGTGTLALGYMF